MARYLLTRLLQFVPTFIGVTLIVFALLQLAPGEPSVVSDDPASVTPAASLQAWRDLRGLDRPLWVQYADWLGRVASLDFGRSLVDERPVRALLAEALPRTLLLTLLALLLTYAVAIPLGLYGGLRAGSAGDRLLTTLVFIFFSVPPFWTALVLIVLFGGGNLLDLFPIRGLHSPGAEEMSAAGRALDLAWHLVLPVLCLTLPAVARVSRFQRAAVLEVKHSPHLRTARAKGLPRRAVLRRHLLKASLLPVLTLISLDLPWLVGGSVIVERIFSIRGMGLLAFDAILRRDYPVIMGVVSLAALTTMLGILLADLAHAWVDPRIRPGRPVS
jgi:peptide/nickel transport system permease protein